jgi:acyl carrier protein
MVDRIPSDSTQIQASQVPAKYSLPGGESMRSKDIATQVKSIVAKHLGVAAEKVVEDATFIEDLRADSLDVVELVMAFEEKFDIEIPDGDVAKIQTVKDAVDYVVSKKN